MNNIRKSGLVHPISEVELYEKVRADVEEDYVGFRGRIIQKDIAKAISHSIARINDFKKIVKKPYYEAKLLEFLLSIIFTKHTHDLGTCWTGFDSKVVTTSKRYFTLVLRLHEDYEVEFRESFEVYLKILKKECRHRDSVFVMPNTFEEFKKKNERIF